MQEVEKVYQEFWKDIVENEDGTLNEDIVSADGYDSQYLLQNNDFLIARSGNTVGKTFLYDDSGDYCMCKLHAYYGDKNVSLNVSDVMVDLPDDYMYSDNDNINITLCLFM